MDAKINKYISNLMLKQKYDMHKPFFINNPKLKEIKIKIINDNKQEKIIPIRNIECLFPNCIYNVDELIEKIKIANFNEKYSFECNYCENIISLDKFYVDTTLKKEIDRIWDTMNIKSIVVREINQNKDGACVPDLIADQNDNLASVKSSQVQKKNPTIINNGEIKPNEDGILRSKDNALYRYMLEGKLMSLFYASLPSLKDSSSSELLTLKQQLIKDKPHNQKLLDLYLIPIIIEDISRIEETNSISEHLIICYLLYIINFVFLYDKSNRSYIFPIIITQFDKNTDNVEYKILNGFKNSYIYETKKFLSKYDKIILCIKYDGRWFLSIYSILRQHIMIIDFLSPDISNVSKNEQSSLMKAILEKEYDMNISITAYHDKNTIEKSRRFQDCSIPFCKAIHGLLLDKLTPEKLILSANVFNYGKDLMWLFLKLSTISLIIYDPNNPQHNMGNLNPPNSNSSALLKGSSNPRGLDGPHEEGSTIHMFSFDDKPNDKDDVSLLNIDSRFKVKDISRISFASKDENKNNNNNHHSMKRKDSIHGINKSSSTSDKVKIGRKDLAEMFRNIKEEAIAEIENEDRTINDILDEEGILNNNGNSQVIVNKSQMLDLLNKIKEKEKSKSSNTSNIDNKKPRKEPQTYEEYMKEYNKYIQETQQFYTDLNFLYQANPGLYQKVESELKTQMEDKMLEKYNLLHVKYPHLKPFNPYKAHLPLLSQNVENNNDHNPSQPGFNQFPAQAKSIHSYSHASLPPINTKVRMDDSFGRLIMDEVNEKRSPASSQLNKGFMEKSNRSPIISSISPTNVRSSKLISSDIYPGSADRIISHDGIQGIDNIKQSNMLSHSKKSSNDMRMIIPDRLDDKIMAQRYGIDIKKSELKDLAYGKVNNIIINFFMKYLEERQQYLSSKMKKGAENVSNMPKIYYFNLRFYDKLTNGDPNTTEINYDNVKNKTSNYSGPNNTIFDIFHYIVFIGKKNLEKYCLIIVDCKNKKIILYDSDKENQDLNKHKMVYQITQYMNKEFNSKALMKMSIYKWQYENGYFNLDENNIQDTGLMTIKLLYKLHLGVENPIITYSNSLNIKNRIFNLIHTIGITKNLQGELDFNKLPLQSIILFDEQ